MDKKYNSPFDRNGRILGLVLTVLVHLCLLLVFFGTGLKYQYPPPAEMGILLEFVDEPEIVPEVKPVKTSVGIEPRAEKPDPNKDISLTQRSEAPVKGNTVNQGDETTVGDEGDVEVPEPPRKKEINKRALFSSNRHRDDTVAVQVAKEATDRLKAGHPEGNTKTGNERSLPSARLKGRTVNGNLPIPEYSVQNSGTVVVEILVDQYGKVTKATPGGKGTTVQDAVLWEAAKKAAMKARFNVSSSAPPVQKGTITYIFKLE